MRKLLKVAVLPICLALGVASAIGQSIPAAEEKTSVFDNAPVYRVGKDIKPPRAKNTPDPCYPPEARRARLTGVTVLWAIIKADGNATDIKVAKPFEPALDQCAVDAVKKWTFKPATLNGRPVAVQINIEINHRPR